MPPRFPVSTGEVYGPRATAERAAAVDRLASALMPYAEALALLFEEEDTAVVMGELDDVRELVGATGLALPPEHPGLVLSAIGRAELATRLRTLDREHDATKAEHGPPDQRPPRPGARLLVVAIKGNLAVTWSKAERSLPRPLHENVHAEGRS